MHSANIGFAFLKLNILKYKVQAQQSKLTKKILVVLPFFNPNSISNLCT